MDIDGDNTRSHPPRSLRARNPPSSEGRPTDSRKTSTAKYDLSKPSGNSETRRKKGSTATPSASVAVASDRIRPASDSDSESSEESTVDTSFVSAPATPATALSVSTAQSSSSGSAGKKAQQASDAAPPTEAAGTKVQAAPSPPRFLTGKKGKGKAVEPTTPSKQSESTPLRRLRSNSSAKKTLNGSSDLKPSTSKKRAAETGPSDASPRSDAAKRPRKSSTSGTSPYNLRSRQPSLFEASSSRAKTDATKMTPRKGSGDFSLTRGTQAGTSQPATRSGSPATKGKAKAKGGRGARSSKTRRDSDDFDCADEVQDRSYDGHEAVDDDGGCGAAVHPDDEAEDVDMGDAEKLPTEERAGDDAAHGAKSGDEDGKSGGKAGAPADDVENEDGYGTVDDEDHFDDDDDDEDHDDPYAGAREDAAAGAFGLNLRAMAGYMSGLTGRFRTLLASLKNSGDPTTQLVSLQELSELLSVSTEDTLAGYFPTEAFVKELIYIMGGPKPTEGRAAGSKAQDTDGDEEMAAALAAAAAADFEEDNGEKMILASRCLANLIEAMPYTAHSVVSNGAIPVLTSKLMEITFIDLAEQVLQTLEKISQEFPSAIVKEGGLMAILQYLDFFNIHIQRTAMTAAANCCRKLSIESFAMVKDVMPTIQNVLGYSDQRLVESACKCVVRIVESYRHQPDLLEQLLTSSLLSAVNELLMPASASGKAGSNTVLGSNTYTDVLKALGTACRASPKVAVTLLENNVVGVLYHLLTGSVAPDSISAATDSGSAATNDGSAGKVQAMELESAGAKAGGAEAAAVAVVPDAQGVVAVADMAVLQNLAQRPKEQVQEALSLIGELLPPLPKDGVFDPRAYTEKALLKRKSQEAKARRKSASSGAKESEAGSQTGLSAQTSTRSGEAAAATDDATGSAKASPVSSSGNSPSSSKLDKPRSEREASKEAAQAARVDMLKRRRYIVERFTQLILPTLVEVYAASVAPNVRNKALNGILKILSFVEAEALSKALDKVPLAGFVAAILSARDHASLVHGALQIVELLTIKLPNIYTALLRREGVMWEIESIAEQEPTHKRSSKKPTDGADKSDASQPQIAAISLPSGTSSQTAEGGSETVEDRSATSGLARLLGTGSSNETRTTAAAIIGSSSGSAARTSTSAHSQVEAADANIWRARMLRSKYSEQATSSAGAKQAVQTLDHIKQLVEKLNKEAAVDGSTAKSTVDEITSLFLKADEPISSFELLRSGLVEGLYRFATSAVEDGLPLTQRRRILIDSLMRVDAAGTTAASVLVRRLQDSLSRLENVDITTALSGGSDDSRRSATSMLGRQLRLRLVAEDSSGEIPRTCTNIVVTIHAVATFQSLNDYLRPKIASASAANAGSGTGSGSSSSRLSSVLAAFAAATGAGSGGFPDLSDRGATASSSRDAPTSALTDTDTKAGETAEAAKKGDEVEAAASGSKKSSPRRSSRLNKASDTEVAGAQASRDGEGVASAVAPTSGDSSAQKEAEATDKDGGAAGGSNAEVTAADDTTSEATRRTATGDEARAFAERLFGESMEGESDEALARRLMDGLLHEGLEDDEGFSDEEFDEEILQSEIAADAPAGLMDDDAEAADKTINLDVDKDAGQVVAKTPDGTQVPSPRNGSATPGPSASATDSPSKPSYASALQKKPSDWHLEFSLDSQPLTLDTTVYGAIHRFETSPARSGTAHGAASSRYIWGNVYTVKYKKVEGPAPKTREDGTPEPRDSASVAIELPPSVKDDAPYAKLLQLLAVLHDLNADWREAHRSGADSPTDALAAASALPESAFVNNKLTAKLNRQLEEPMIVASACLPAWSLELPKVFPFLFPFEARFSFLQSTAFGYARLITRWQTLHTRNQDNTSSSLRLDDSFGFLARLQRQKVRISRSSLLPSAFKVLELYGSTSSVLEVEYFEEVGTGLGPTLEFYSLVSKEFARKDLGLWRDDDAAGSESLWVRSANGLFPAPIDEVQAATAEGRKRIHSFKILGQFIAKALLDSRIIDCNFSPVFMRAVLNQPIVPSLNALASVDPSLARSLKAMKKMPADDIAGLALDFTVPGHPDIELHPGGREESVDATNLDRYISEVLAVSLDVGVKPAVRAFRQGFNLIFPIAAMSSFTADELVMLFGNTEEDWSETTLMSSIKPDHGLNAESASFKDIVAIMSSFTVVERRDFLQWLTGSPKLPIGGFAGLHPQLTVVKRPHEPPLTADDYLPSVMTCVNYLKMPLYSSRETMRRRLEVAMKEGSTSFHLS